MAAVADRQTFLLPRSAEPGVEIFAVGDIHGRSDLLLALLDEAGREPRRREKRTIVFLGDLVDRGPDSLGAIDLTMDARWRVGADESIALMGNHEAMMRLALDADTPWDAAVDALDAWLGNGGAATVREFAAFESPPSDIDELLTIIRVALPERIRKWLGGLRTYWRSGDILLVHAGVNPHVGLDDFLATPWNTPLAHLDQDFHWAWVRWPFLEFAAAPDGFSGLFVVHGHTPNDARVMPSHDGQIARFRLNLDAGSAMTGVAKMAVIRGNEAKVVTIVGPTERMLRKE